MGAGSLIREGDGTSCQGVCILEEKHQHLRRKQRRSKSRNVYKNLVWGEVKASFLSVVEKSKQLNNVEGCR